MDHALASDALDPALLPDRSDGGADDPANLTTLCAAHHQRGVHAGVIRITGRAPDALVFELPLGRFRSGDRYATLPGLARSQP